MISAVVLSNDHEFANTRAKLLRLETRYAALRDEVGGDQELRDATMESLKRLINQLREEISRYKAHQSA